MSHTYALMEVTPGTYAEIRDKLKAAGYSHAIGTGGENDEVLDLNGIALLEGPLDEGILIDLSSEAYLQVRAQMETGRPEAIEGDEAGEVINMSGAVVSEKQP